MSAFTLRRIEELETISHGAVKLAGDGLRVRAFGLQVLDLPPGFTDYPEHDHVHDGQEEVYVVLEGTARFDVAGETAHAEAGAMVRIDADAKRKLVAGSDGARVLAIGCAPGVAYERPKTFRSAAS